MGPPIPHNRNAPPERVPETLRAIAQRWGDAAVEQLYALFPNGTRWTRFASHGRLAWVYADTPDRGSALFVRTGNTFTAFPRARFTGAEPDAFAAVLADAQLDVVADKDEVIAAFAAVTGAEPVLTQQDAESLLRSPYSRDEENGADPAAIVLFEPPHFRGRTLAFVATFRYAAQLVRILVDADTLAVRVEMLGRSQRHFMPVG